MTNSRHKIAGVDAYQVFDSRGNPTVEAVVTLADGSSGRGTVPSGASTGSHEAHELRDGDVTCFRGRSVYRAIENVNCIIGPELMKLPLADQRMVDECLVALDGTANRSRLGANALLAVSMAYCWAAARSQRLPLFEHLGQGRGNLIPLPEIQIMGGGAHAGRTIDIQDFMIVAMRAQSFAEALEVTFNVYQATASLLQERGQLYGVADEGGFWPVVKSNEHVFEVLLQAIEAAGYVPGVDVSISLDIAATDLFHEGRYHLASEGRAFTTDEFTRLLVDWTKRYPICSIEDPMHEEDWDGWQSVMQEIGDRVQVVGDDLFTTNLGRIELGLAARSANAVLIKPNQIGTVSETMDAIRATQRGGWNPVVSARSGETEDTFIANLAVATNAGQLKVGSFSRSERMAKWNEVLRIERQLGVSARYLGARILSPAAERGSVGGGQSGDS